MNKKEVKVTVDAPEPDVTPFSCMTDEQRRHANAVVDRMLKHVTHTIVREGPGITAMDKRPYEVSPKRAECLFPVCQPKLA